MNMLGSIWGVLKKLAQSRKVAIGLAGLVPAILAECGIQVSEEFVLRVLGIAALLIGGIAAEDFAAKLKAPTPVDAKADVEAGR